MELATIIQAICSNDDEVMALLLNDPAFDRQHLADLNGVVVMGITFNSSMMMLHKESDVAEFAHFLAACHEAIGVTITAAGIRCEVERMLELRANRGDVTCPLIVLADEVFFVSGIHSMKFYAGYPTAGDATRSYLCKTASVSGGVVGMSSLLNDDIMRERRTGALRPVYEMATLPIFDSFAVFRNHLDQAAERGICINTAGELLDCKVGSDQGASCKGAYRRNALLAV
eukprot:contig_1120_g145